MLNAEGVKSRSENAETAKMLARAPTTSAERSIARKTPDADEKAYEQFKMTELP